MTADRPLDGPLVSRIDRRLPYRAQIRVRLKTIQGRSKSFACRGLPSKDANPVSILPLLLETAHPGI